MDSRAEEAQGGLALPAEGAEPVCAARSLVVVLGSEDWAMSPRRFQGRARRRGAWPAGRF